MTPDLCIMCGQLSHGRKCTLHGGSLTATEACLHARYQVSNGAWIEKPASVQAWERAIKTLQDNPLPSDLDMYDPITGQIYKGQNR